MLSNESRPFGSARSSNTAQKSSKPRAGKAGPRFIFINGRTPHQSAHCASCREPISDGYVREIATGLLYCDYRCSGRHSRLAEFASRLRAWVVS